MSTAKTIPAGTFKAAQTMRINVTGTYIPRSSPSIRLTPNQANTIVDICQRLNIAAPLCDGEYHSWLRSACVHYIAYLTLHKRRIASQDATEVIIECLRDARDGMAGYNLMAELERAEAYCRKHDL